MSDRPPKNGKPGTAWNCPKVPGLRLRFQATKATYYLYYRTKAGKQRNMKLGDAANFTLTDAREKARAILTEVANGADPAGLRGALAGRPTMQMLHEWHLEKHADAKNKASWRTDIDRIYRLHVLPEFGKDTAVADITVADVEKLHYKMRATPYQANRTAAMLQKAFNLAERWGWRPRFSNPVQVEKYKEQKRKRVPQADEAVRLLIALESMRDSDPWFVGLIELLCLTGARLNEIKSAKWEWVKEDGIHLPDSKTGEKTIYLSTLAREALAQIPRLQGNPYIICGKRKDQHLVNERPQWKRLMEKANITEDLRRHDLRRFFASAGISGGLELSQVGELLGHMSPITTKRYAFLLTDAASAAAERASENVRQIMTGAGKVRAISGGR